jgi:hypothetical protein
MKQVSVARFVSLVVMAVPTMALADESFFAMKRVQIPERNSLTPLNDEQLASVEGQNLLNIGFGLSTQVLETLKSQQLQGNVAISKNVRFGNVTTGDFTQTTTIGTQTLP